MSSSSSQNNSTDTPITTQVGKGVGPLSAQGLQEAMEREERAAAAAAAQKEQQESTSVATTDDGMVDEDNAAGEVLVEGKDNGSSSEDDTSSSEEDTSSAFEDDIEAVEDGIAAAKNRTTLFQAAKSALDLMKVMKTFHGSPKTDEEYQNVAPDVAALAEIVGSIRNKVNAFTTEADRQEGCKILSACLARATNVFKYCTTINGALIKVRAAAKNSAEGLRKSFNAGIGADERLAKKEAQKAKIDAKVTAGLAEQEKAGAAVEKARIATQFKTTEKDVEVAVARHEGLVDLADDVNNAINGAKVQTHTVSPAALKSKATKRAKESQNPASAKKIMKH